MNIKWIMFVVKVSDISTEKLLEIMDLLVLEMNFFSFFVNLKERILSSILLIIKILL